MYSRYIPVINIIETFLPTVVFYLYDLEFLDRGKKTKVSQFYISRFPPISSLYRGLSPCGAIINIYLT